jgi:hypothetical protein
MRRFSDADLEKLRLMASVGHPGTSIARALDRTPQSIRVKAVELGVRLRPEKTDRAARVVMTAETRFALAAAAARRGRASCGLPTCS